MRIGKVGFGRSGRELFFVFRNQLFIFGHEFTIRALGKNQLLFFQILEGLLHSIRVNLGLIRQFTYRWESTTRRALPRHDRQPQLLYQLKIDGPFVVEYEFNKRPFYCITCLIQ